MFYNCFKNNKGHIISIQKREELDKELNFSNFDKDSSFEKSKS